MSHFKFLAALLATAVYTLIGSAWTQSHATDLEIPAIVDENGDAVSGSVASLERVTLGGVEQTILIRAHDTNQPVLLFLHGGPGGSVMPWVDLFHTPLLESNFIVVHWDQRGAGSSYSPELTVDDISPEQLVADTLELTGLLQERFDQDRIFLSGQSWGSALGFLTLAEDSSPFLAFIATSERVAWGRSLTMGFNWALAQAEELGDSEILAQLRAIEPFDPLDEADLIVQRQALDFYRAGDYHTVGLWDQYLGYALSGQSPYYTIAQIQDFIPGLELSSAAIEVPEILGAYDLFTTFREAEIPVHFITGAQDHNTPGDLARLYHDALLAHAKSFTLIEGAAHMVMYDQPEAWAETLVEIRNETLNR